LRLQEKTLRLAQKKQIDLLRLTSKGYPVTGFNDTFNIYSKLGSFSAKDRADAISFRIKKLR
jgi:hypothetical protein